MSVRTDRRGAVWVVTIDRPDRRGAVDRPHAEALDEAFATFDQDPELAVAVLTGTAGSFCAGADLHALGDPDLANRIDRVEDGPMGPTRRILTKPVIAAVEGHAVAGGLELALWCDLRVASTSAVFGVFCRRVGVPLIDGGTVRLPQIIGMGRALDLILTGRAVDAHEALAMGLVSRVTDEGRALDEAVTLAEQLAQLPQTTLRSDLQGTRRAFDQPLPEALAREHHAGVAAIEAGGLDEGVRAFQSGSGRGGAPIETSRP